MNDDDLAHLRGFTYHQSRIPALDALATFVPTGEESDPVLREVIARTGFSRWSPVTGGHRVLILHERGSYDPNRFTLEKGAWDHEHCWSCRTRIPPMTLCWVTKSGPYILLCEECHRIVDESRNA